MKIRQGKDIILRWKITTNGEALPLEGRNLTLILSTPNGRERVLSYTTEGDTISTRLFGKEITLLGDYTLTLWENRGEQGQTAVDAVNAFELVKYTTMEEDGSSCGNLEAEVLSLSGDLGVFQQGTTTEKNEQVDRNTADIAELQEDVNAINITLNDLEKADASLREEIANAKDKDAEQDEEMSSLLDILEGKLDIKDLGSGLRPDQAVSEIINYVRSNNIKSALVFKYIDTDNSSTFGICISRMGVSGWIIYLIARKGIEVLKFNSYGSRETWNEYGGVLRHDMNSVADEQLECLSIKGLKSVLAKKQDTLVSGTNIKTINGQSIMGSGNIKIEAGITEEEKAEINAKIEGKADNTEFQQVKQQQLQLTVKDNGNIVLSNLNGQSQEFMKATPSGDPMHYAYVSAGAEYNETDNFIVKDAPWKDLVDPIDYKAQWGFDIVADNLVQSDSITYNGISYRYAKDTEFVFNSVTKQRVAYDRYRIVIQDNNTNKWVWDDTLTLHLPKHWYLHGIGNISNQEMCYTYYIGPPLNLYGFAGNANVRTILPSNNQLFTIPNLFGSNAGYLKSCIFPNETQIGNNSTMFVYTNGPRNMIGKYMNVTAGATTIPSSSNPVHFNPKISKNLTIKSKNISWKSVLYIINNASPTSAISITLHPDAYARLAEDADIVAALEAKPLVTLVSA